MKHSPGRKERRRQFKLSLTKGYGNHDQYAFKRISKRRANKN